MNKIGYKDAVYVGEMRTQKHTIYGNTVLYTDIIYLMIAIERTLSFAYRRGLNATMTGRATLALQ
jgi:hypothetical protein